MSNGRRNWGLKRIPTPIVAMAAFTLEPTMVRRVIRSIKAIAVC